MKSAARCPCCPRGAKLHDGQAGPHLAAHTWRCPSLPRAQLPRLTSAFLAVVTKTQLRGLKTQENGTYGFGIETP